MTFQLWSNYPERISTGYSRWQLLYMGIYASIVSAFIVTTLRGDTHVSPLWIVLIRILYIGFTFLSVIVLLPRLSFRLRTGGYAEYLYFECRPSWAYRWMRFLEMIGIYIGGVAMFISLTLLTDRLLAYAYPGITRIINSQGALLSVPFSVLLISGFGALEEIWRLVLIALLLIGLRRLVGTSWERILVKWSLVLTAILVSSLLFGLGHISNVPSYPGTIFIMAFLDGIYLAVLGFITRRASVVILAHFVYNMLVSFQLYSVTPIVFMISLVCLFFIFPATWLLYQRTWPLLNIGQDPFITV